MPVMLQRVAQIRRFLVLTLVAPPVVVYFLLLMLVSYRVRITVVAARATCPSSLTARISIV